MHHEPRLHFDYPGHRRSAYTDQHSQRDRQRDQRDRPIGTATTIRRKPSSYQPDTKPAYGSGDLAHVYTPAGAPRAQHRLDAHVRPRQDQPYLTTSTRQPLLEPRTASCQTARQKPAVCHRSAYSRVVIHSSTSTIAQDLRADEAPASTISHLRDCPSKHTTPTAACGQHQTDIRAHADSRIRQDTTR